MTNVNWWFFESFDMLIITPLLQVAHLIVSREDPVELLVGGAPLRVSDVVAGPGDAPVPLFNVAAGAGGSPRYQGTVSGWNEGWITKTFAIHGVLSASSLGILWVSAGF